MTDVGFTHVALPVTNLDASADFYATFAGLEVIHRRAQAGDRDRDIAWLNDGVRSFVLVLAETPRVDHPLGPFAHLGIACVSREAMDELCEKASRAGVLRDPPRETGGPAGYLANLSDPDGHTLELSCGQETGLAVEQAT